MIVFEKKGLIKRRWNENSDSSLSSLNSLFGSVFLPAGYPDSVSDDYCWYQVFDTAQAFCSTCSGVLATQAVLTSLGVGDASASALSATLNYVVRDVSGLVARIAFAATLSTSLDCFAKQWRLVADVLNDLAQLLELAAPSLPRVYLLPVLCLSSVSRAVVGVAGSCTRSVITQHQAQRENAADVSSKDGNQETAVNLIGLACGSLLVGVVAGSPVWSWAVFLLLLVFHIACNYGAVRSVRLRSLNRLRTVMCLDHFIATGHCLSPAEIGLREPLVFGWWAAGSHIQLGVPLREILKTTNDDDDAAVVEQLDHRKLAGGGGGNEQFVLGGSTGAAHKVAFVHGYSCKSELKAFVTAYLTTGRDVKRELLQNRVDQFLQSASAAGWLLDHSKLGTQGWTFEIVDDSKKKK